MILTALQSHLWALSFICHVVLACIMIGRESYKRWLALFSLIIFDIFVTVSLYNVRSHYSTYFYIYWAAALLRAFIGLGILFDVVRSIPGIRFAPYQLIAGFIALASVLAIGAACVASGGGAETFRITMMALALQRCVVVVWGVFAVVMFWSVSFCGLAWSRTPQRLAVSFIAFIFISGLSAYAMSAWPHYGGKIDQIANLCTLCIYVSWSHIMLCEKVRERIAESDRVIDLAKALYFNQSTPQTEKGSGYDT